MATEVAVALPAELLTWMQYSIVAPGIGLGLTVLLNGSEMILLVFRIVSAAAETV